MANEEREVGGENEEVNKNLPVLPHDPKVFGGIPLPEAEEAFKRQQALIDLAEGLLKEEDYAYVVHALTGAEKPVQPKMFGNKEDAQKYSKQYEKASGHKTKIVRTKLKSAWLRLGLHLGVTVPRGQENVPVKKEVTMLKENLMCIKTTGPGYESISIVSVQKGPEGMLTGKTIHSETTAALEWPSTGRIAVRSGASAISERTFAHKTHDVLAMGETRAFSRTTACLLGFGDTTAEEFEKGEVEEEPKPQPKSSPKKKNDSKNKKAPVASTKEEPKKTEQDTVEEPENRKEILDGAVALSGGDVDKAMAFWKDWKEKKHAENDSFDVTIRMSKLSDELWAELKKDLTQWANEEAKKGK